MYHSLHYTSVVQLRMLTNAISTEIKRVIYVDTKKIDRSLSYELVCSPPLLVCSPHLSRNISLKYHHCFLGVKFIHSTLVMVNQTIEF